jgi:hypothetical protein
MKATSERFKNKKKQIEHGLSYTKIMAGRRGKLLILRSVRVLASDKGQELSLAKKA